jgi:hypothetical protein
LRAFRVIVGGAEQLKAEGQQSGAPPVGEKAEVADANEAFREQVQRKATLEFLYVQGHPALPVLVSGVSPPERDLVIGEGD